MLRHHNCTNGNGCAANQPATTTCNTITVAAGTTCDFYDGLDRLVEVKLPYDGSVDLYTKPWVTRYLYDLTGGQQSFQGSGLYAHGNLFEVQELVSLTPSANSPFHTASITNGTFLGIKGFAYDAIDRLVSKYSWAGANVINEQLTWDTSPIQNNVAGLLGEDCNGLSSPQCQEFEYLPDGEILTFESSDGTSPERDYTYDPDGRPTRILSHAYTNPQTYAYDADGNVATSTDAGNTTSAQATLTHDRYPDGLEEDLDVSSAALSQQALFTYSYRNDGPLETYAINDSSLGSSIVHAGTTTLAYTYTDAGRFAGRQESGAAASTSLPAWSVTYKTNPANGLSIGLVGTETTPVTTLSNFSYTAEGEITALSSSASNPACLYPTPIYSYSLRGELINSPNCGSTGAEPFLANGVSLRGSPVVAGEAYSWNGAMAVITQSTTAGFSTPCNQGTQPCTSAWGYDSAGRMTGQVAPYPPVAVSPPPNNTTTARTYDAENHLTMTQFQLGGAAGSSTWGNEIVAWGPDGHPIKIGTYTGQNNQSQEKDERLHWNGNQLLFTTNPSGSNGSAVLDDIKIDVQGDILPADTYNGLTFYDRGPGGTIIGCHNKTGNSFVGLTDSWGAFGISPCSQNKSNGFLPPTTIIWNSSTAAGATPSIGTGGVLGMPRTDGFVDGYDTIQGRRSYDSTAGVWTAPDNYLGADADPASQKSYLWNNNNPLGYVDPSGNDAGDSDSSTPTGTEQCSGTTCQQAQSCPADAGNCPGSQSSCGTGMILTSDGQCAVESKPSSKMAGGLPADPSGLSSDWRAIDFERGERFYYNPDIEQFLRHNTDTPKRPWRVYPLGPPKSDNTPRPDGGNKIRTPGGDGHWAEGEYPPGWLFWGGALAAGAAALIQQILSQPVPAW
ncbi:MAG TPA: hypothetical protein VMU38_02100 [Candidatus Binatia bacterium]|nr:hypothetical protein [Candidatus Binatia bacterium]